MKPPRSRTCRVAFDRIGDFGVLAGKPRVAAWRRALAARPSVGRAVGRDYDERLWAFLKARKSHLSGLMAPLCPEGGS